MARTRVKLAVYVDLDPTYGAFHTAMSAAKHVRVILENSVPHYNPDVLLESSDVDEDASTRAGNISSNETHYSKESAMNEFLENLKREAEAQPLLAMGVAAGLLTAAGKFVEAAGSVKSKRAYARQFGSTSKKALK